MKKKGNIFKKIPRKLYKFTKSKSLKKYVTSVITMGILIVISLSIFLLLSPKDALTDIISTILGFAISSFAAYCFAAWIVLVEDRLKVDTDATSLKERYLPEFIHNISWGNHTEELLYQECLENRKCKSIIFEDDPETLYDIPSFVENNFFDIMESHKNAVKKNEYTVRLKGFRVEDDKLIIQTERSNFFAFLTTNRAADYDLGNGITMRDIYEPGPSLKDLDKTNMANHIGLNAIVVLSDGNVIYPCRGGTSTISKNMLTSSIAVKLPPIKQKIENDYFVETIEKMLSIKTLMKAETLAKHTYSTEFLTFVRSIYEAGKPQFYYIVKFNDLDTKEYLHQLDKKELFARPNTIDQDKDILVVDVKSSYLDEKGRLVPTIVTLDKNNNLVYKKSKKSYPLERSMLINMHYTDMLK